MRTFIFILIIIGLIAVDLYSESGFDIEKQCWKELKFETGKKDRILAEKECLNELKFVNGTDVTRRIKAIFGLNGTSYYIIKEKK